MLFSKVNKQILNKIDIKSRSLFEDALYRFLKHKIAVVSLIILTIITILVISGSYISPYSYDHIDSSMQNTPPSIATKHYFGTDSLGRDLFVRTAQGGKISLMVGFLGALIAVFFGTLFGSISGFIGGKTDNIMMRFVDILASFPFMFFVILLVTFFGRNISLIFIAIGMVSWLDIARIVRGQTLSLKTKEFIEAAHISGTSRFNIVTKHIIPNVLGVVIVYTTLLIPNMIVFESFLSFLGLGVQEPNASWGSLINAGAAAMPNSLWLLLIPGSALVITLFCFNFIGDGLRDALDPKDR